MWILQLISSDATTCEIFKLSSPPTVFGSTIDKINHGDLITSKHERDTVCYLFYKSLAGYLLFKKL